MIKLLGPIAKILFAVFVLVVIGAVAYYSYHALGKIFPTDFLGQIFGMVLFDVATIIWFLTFIAGCSSTMQYAFSVLGFLLGLGGTLGLVGIEVGLSSGAFLPGDMTRPLTYIFIGALIGHLVIIYAHHASSPTVSADISLGVEKARITDQAQKDAEKMLRENISLLSGAIAGELVKQVIQDLNLEPRNGEVLDLQALDVVPSSQPAPAGGVASFLSRILSGWGSGAKRYQSSVQSVGTSSPPQTPTPSPAQGNVAPGGGGSNTPIV